jgi:hypothetical protein
MSATNSWHVLHNASKTADYTTAGEGIIFVNPTGGAFTITIGERDTVAGREIKIVNTSTSTNAVTIKAESGTINGTAGATGITGNNATREVITLFCDGTNWYAVQSPIPS